VVVPGSVYVIGSARTDFKRNLKKEGLALRDVIVEAGRGAIADAGVSPADVQAGVVGNFAGGMFTKQLHLGAMLLDIDEALRGIPTMHVEAACASGGVAVLTAAQQIMGGLYDCVLVVGAEQQKTMSPAEGADVLGAAGDFAIERPRYGEFMFPKLFGRIAELYAARYGLTERQLAFVAAKASAHAQLNPMAQTRGKVVGLEAAGVESESNARVAGMLKLCDCSQITDGAAAVVLCSEAFARKLGSSRSPVRLAGYGHTTDYLALERKTVPEFSIARRAAARALDRAGWRPGELDGAEVHDCFSITEIVAYELLGLAPPGDGPMLVESGATTLPCVRREMGLAEPPVSVPVNAGGGLLAEGHPVGATGVRQVDEMYRQLTGRAGARQIAGAKKFLTFNMGGSVTTSVVMTWQGGHG
jgi:acetyl-CoA C-acetyltransferase